MSRVDPLPRRPQRATVAVTALLHGGTAAGVAAQLDDLRAQRLQIDAAWVIQSPHDPAITALGRREGHPAVRILGSDRTLGPWAPILFAWFLATPYALLLAPGIRLGPDFVGAAMLAMRRRRAVVSPFGSRQGAPVAGGAEDRPVDAGGGAWLFETSWIRHVWRTPPSDLQADPTAALEAAFRQSGIPAVVPALAGGTASHLAA